MKRVYREWNVLQLLLGRKFASSLIRKLTTKNSKTLKPKKNFKS